MKWLKKNKMMIVAIVVFIMITLIGYKAIMVFFPATDKAIYGDRLDSKVPVHTELYAGIETRIGDKEFVKSVDVRESGRIINIVVTVMDSTSMDAAKGLSKLILEGFSDSQIGYYDFQLLIKKEDSKENDFPIIAYKQHNSTDFYWTKDREKKDTSVDDTSKEEG